MKHFTFLLVFVICAAVAQGQVNWEQPLLHGNDLQAIDFTDNDHVYILGRMYSQERIYGQWTPVSNVDTTLHYNFKAISMIDTSNGWAIAYPSSLYHYDANGWSFYQDFPQVLGDIEFTDANHGWIVGDSGTIYHYNGSGWIIQPTPFQDLLTGVTFINDSTGWACGFEGHILKYQSGIWTNQPYGFNGFYIDWSDIHALGTDYIWAVNPIGSALHFDGTSWSYMATTAGSTSLYRVQFTDSTHGWALGGSGSIFFYDGSTWSIQFADSMFYYNSFRDLKMISNQDGYAIGEGGILIHWDGNNWIKETQTVTQTQLQDIVALDTNHVFACGQMALLSRKNGSWVNEYNFGYNGKTYIDMDFYNPAFGIALTNTVGEYALYIDSVWVLKTDMGIYSHKVVDIIDTSHIWAGGNRITFFNGINWVDEFNPGSSVSSISMIDTLNGFASNDSALYRYNNGVWIQMPFPHSGNIQAIYFTSITDGWVINQDVDSIRFYHYLNGQWTMQAFYQKNLLVFDVSFRTPTDGYLVINYFNEGVYYRCNGTSWSKVPQNLTASRIFGISFADSLNGWACGEDGMILKIYNNTVTAVEEFPDGYGTNGSNFNVYPNPTTGILHISIGSPLQGTSVISIYNTEGQLMSSEKRFFTGDNQILELNPELKDGMYYYHVSNGITSQSGKFLLDKK